MDTEVAIEAGGTALLYNSMNGEKTCERLAETASGQLLLREAAHQYLYTIANSYATELEPQTSPWRKTVILVSIALYVVSIGGLTAMYAKKRNKNK